MCLDNKAKELTYLNREFILERKKMNGSRPISWSSFLLTLVQWIFSINLQIPLKNSKPKRIVLVRIFVVFLFSFFSFYFFPMNFFIRFCFFGSGFYLWCPAKETEPKKSTECRNVTHHRAKASKTRVTTSALR